MAGVLLLATVLSACSEGRLASVDRATDNPSERLIASAFTVAEKLFTIGASLHLTARPTWDDLGGYLTTDRDEDTDVDELTKPQLTISRLLGKSNTGLTGPHYLDISASAPVGGGSVCYLELKFVLAQSSSLVKGDLSSEAGRQAVVDHRLDLTLESVGIADSVGVRELSMVEHVVRNESSGDFILSVAGTGYAAHPDAADLRKRTDALRAVSDCVSEAFGGISQESSRMIDGEYLETIGVCTSPCVSSGSMTFEHPTWGRVELVTAIAIHSADNSGFTAILDDSRTLLWTYGGQGIPEVLPAPLFDADKTGNLFLQFESSYGSGLVILRPTASGISDLGTLPPIGGGDARFPRASVLDRDGDDTVEVLALVPACADESCIETTWSPVDCYWDGTDYIPLTEGP